MIKKILIFSIFMSASLLSHSQENTELEDAIKKLEEAKAAKTEAEERLKAAQAYVDKIKPIPTWTKGGFLTLNIGQTALVNWVPGGNSNISAALVGHYHFNYKKKKHNWDNSIDGKWGVVKNWDLVTGKNDPIRKNDDRLQVTSKYGYDVTKKGKLNAGLLLDFLSQFSPTYSLTADQKKDSVLVSRFAAPAYLKISPGMEYKFNQYFKIFFSPSTGKFTFVTDSLLSAQGAYGVDKGEKARAEFGAYFTAWFDKEIVKNINFKSQLDLFDNFLNKDTDYNGKTKRLNIDVNWRNDFTMKVNKYITINIFTTLVYDDDQRINIEGKGLVPRTQFSENLGVGFTYNIK